MTGYTPKVEDVKYAKTAKHLTKGDLVLNILNRKYYPLESVKRFGAGYIIELEGSDDGCSYYSDYSDRHTVLSITEVVGSPEADIKGNLKVFFRDFAEWLDAMPEHPVFSKSRSLCYTAEKWFLRCGYDHELVFKVEEELEVLFRGVDCADFNCPFNEDGYVGWRKELKEDTFYRNPKRLAFIKENAK